MFFFLLFICTLLCLCIFAFYKKIEAIIVSGLILGVSFIGLFAGITISSLEYYRAEQTIRAVVEQYNQTDKTDNDWNQVVIQCEEINSIIADIHRADNYWFDIADAFNLFSLEDYTITVFEDRIEFSDEYNLPLLIKGS